jgi:two-component system LytT family response regulator
LVGSVGSGVEGLAQMRTLLPDLVFLEINLPEMSGFDFLHKVSPVMQPQFVLLSSTEDSATRAFEYFVFDYLLKPFTRERLQLTLIKIREQMDQVRNTHLHEKLNALFRYINPAQRSEHALGMNGREKPVPVKMSGRIYFIHPADIEYVEGAGYYIEVYAKNKKHLIRQSLTQLAELLDKHRFVRIHRSVIINTHFLKEVIRDGANDFSVRMSNDATFKISRSYKSEVFERIGL